MQYSCFRSSRDEHSHRGLTMHDTGVTESEDAALTNINNTAAENGPVQSQTRLTIHVECPVEKPQSYLSYQEEIKAFCEKHYACVHDPVLRHRVSEASPRCWLETDFLLRRRKAGAGRHLRPSLNASSAANTRADPLPSNSLVTRHGPSI